MIIGTLRAGAVAAALVAGPAALDAATLRGTGVLVLGDSLSDTGNAFALSGGATPPSPPYYQGRFSNGPVWADHVAAAYRAQGLPDANYAVGGAPALGGMALQIGAFDRDGRDLLGPDPVAAIWLGSNDLFTLVDSQPDGPSGESAAEAGARAAALGVDAGIRALAGRGVTDFVVLNVPDLGLVPHYRLGRPDRAEDATQASVVFNETLAGRLAALRADGLSVSEIDTFGLIRALVADPGAFGLEDATTPCLTGDAVCPPAIAAGLAFWDASHPTEAVHAQLADIVLAELAAPVVPVPLPLPAFLLLAGLAALAGTARPALRAV